MSRRIIAPTGLQMTIPAYIEAAGQWPYPCEHGHMSCAAWKHGPCSDELQTEQETEQKRKRRNLRASLNRGARLG